MRAAVAVLALLAGCAGPSVSPPADLASCADPVPVPAAPPRVRTPHQLAQFAIRLELAREAERARGDDCAGKLERLNEWVKAQER